MRTVHGRCILLPSGRGGCDSQVRAVADRLGLVCVPDVPRDDGTDVSLVMTSGPERSDDAAMLGSYLYVPTIGFGQPGPAACRMDLVVTTPQFHVNGRNVLRLDHAISPHGAGDTFSPGRDADALSHLPRPLSLVLVGGPAGPWGLDVDRIVSLVESLSDRGAGVVVLTSARTPVSARSTLGRLGRRNIVIDRIDGNPVRMAVALALCDEAHVTGDSVSMISEVAAVGKPLAVLVPPACGMHVQEYLAEAAADPFHSAMPGDLRRFWAVLGDDLASPRKRSAERPSLDVAAQAIANVMATPMRAAA